MFPELPRSHTFGKIGTDDGLFFDDHLGKMILNNESIDWTKMVSHSWVLVHLLSVLFDTSAYSIHSWLTQAFATDAAIP